MLKVRVDLDVSKIMAKKTGADKAAQMQLDQDVLKDSNFFIPKDTGELERSSLRFSKVGEGELVWQTPYARKMYYNPQYNFSQDVNPNARGLWFEEAKAQKKPDWLEKVREKYANFFNGK